MNVWIDKVERGWKMLNYERHWNKLAADECCAYKARKQAEYRNQKLERRRKADANAGPNAGCAVDGAGGTANLLGAKVNDRLEHLN